MQYHSACVVVSGDPYLQTWVKEPEPWLDSPPPRLPVNCFRDPFLLERPTADNDYNWRVMIGSCVETLEGDCGSCVGTALVYRSKQLRKGE